MLICLNGGLGNQIGNYVFAQYLKEFEEFGADVKIVWSNNVNDARDIVLDKFNTNLDVAAKEDVEKFLRAKTHPGLIFDLLFKNIFDKIWVNNLWNFLKRIRKEYNIYPKKNLNLLSKIVTYKDAMKHKYAHTAVCDCYGPAVKGFYNPAFREKMRQHITLKEELDPKNAAVLKEIKACKNSVGIHIRRGDYIDYKFPVVKKEFIISKMNVLCEKFPDAKFFIFSNGMDWAKENLSNEGFLNLKFVDINDEAHGYLDFVLFNACFHRIYSNSTFSLWLQYLNPYNNSIEFYPEKEDLELVC